MEEKRLITLSELLCIAINCGNSKEAEEEFEKLEKPESPTVQITPARGK